MMPANVVQAPQRVILSECRSLLIQASGKFRCSAEGGSSKIKSPSMAWTLASGGFGHLSWFSNREIAFMFRNDVSKQYYSVYLW